MLKQQRVPWLFDMLSLEDVGTKCRWFFLGGLWKLEMDSWVPVVNCVYWICVAKTSDVGFQKLIEVDLRLLFA